MRATMHFAVHCPKFLLLPAAFANFIIFAMLPLPLTPSLEYEHTLSVPISNTCSHNCVTRRNVLSLLCPLSPPSGFVYIHDDDVHMLASISNVFENNNNKINTGSVV